MIVNICHQSSESESESGFNVAVVGERVTFDLRRSRKKKWSQEASTLMLPGIRRQNAFRGLAGSPGPTLGQKDVGNPAAGGSGASFMGLTRTVFIFIKLILGGYHDKG